MLIRSFTAYWVAFGPHGPRALPPPGEGLRVFSYTMIGVVAAGLIFAGTRMFAREGPSTMNKEWQEATNEYMRVSCLRNGARTRSTRAQFKQAHTANTSPTCRRTRSSPLLSSEEETTTRAPRPWSRAHRRSRSNLGRRQHQLWDNRYCELRRTGPALYTAHHLNTSGVFLALKCRTRGANGRSRRERGHVFYTSAQHLPLYKERRIRRN